jgi:16S rRNA (cytosine967-C5)-methyltransferase
MLTERWLERRERADTLLEGLAQDPKGVGRARCQELFYGVLRWWSRLEAARAGLSAREPRLKVQALMLVAGFELIDGGDASPAPVVHHAVERAKRLLSPAEARFANALLRKMAERLRNQDQKAAAAGEVAGLAAVWAHPEWLVKRWLAQFGLEATRQLLEWNQRPAPVHVRWRRPEAPVPDFLKPTQWPAFFEVAPGHWDEVRRLAREGALYVQDPSTRLSVELLAPQPGEVVLDCCAAPGGKSLLIADVLAQGGGPGTDGTRGRVVALEQADERIDRLKENLSRAPAGIDVALVVGDLRRAASRLFHTHNLPTAFPAVLVDAPCSNTGVMRHRVDVKWRLQAGDFARHAVQQYALLRAAAGLVARGGRLVYSTCSLDAEENEGVIERCTREAGGAWTLERSAFARPWTDGCDGAAVFLLRRRR